jgi:hypothetical protein
MTHFIGIVLPRIKMKMYDVCVYIKSQLFYARAFNSASADEEQDGPKQLAATGL